MASEGSCLGLLLNPQQAPKTCPEIPCHGLEPFPGCPMLTPSLCLSLGASTQLPSCPCAAAGSPLLAVLGWHSCLQQAALLLESFESPASGLGKPQDGQGAGWRHPSCEYTLLACGTRLAGGKGEALIRCKTYIRGLPPSLPANRPSAEVCHHPSERTSRTKRGSTAV